MSQPASRTARRRSSGKASCRMRSPGAAALSRRSAASPRSVSSGGSCDRLKPDIFHNISLKPVLLGTTASLGLARTAVVNSLTGLGTLFIGEAKVSGATRRLVRFALSHLLRRKRSKIVVQNPDDRAFVIELGVPEEAIVLIGGSGVDTQAADAVARAAAARDRRLCRPHARRQGRAHADRGLLVSRQARASRSSSCSPATATRRTRVRSRPSSFASLRAFTASSGSATSPTSGRSGRGRISPCSPRAARACPRACSRRQLAGVRWSRPMLRAAARSPSKGVTALTVPVDDAAALAGAMEKLASDSGLRKRFAANARALVESKFSADAIGKETVGLYDALRAS